MSDQFEKDFSQFVTNVSSLIWTDFKKPFEKASKEISVTRLFEQRPLICELLFNEMKAFNVVFDKYPNKKKWKEKLLEAAGVIFGSLGKILKDPIFEILKELVEISRIFIRSVIRDDAHKHSYDQR